MSLKHITLVAGILLSGYGIFLLTVARGAGIRHTLDLFTTTSASGTVGPGPIPLLGIGLAMIFLATIIPRR